MLSPDTGTVFSRSMLLAVTASLLLHALLLISAGRMQWGWGGTDRARGDSPRGNLLLARLDLPTHLPEPLGSNTLPADDTAAVVVRTGTDAIQPHSTPLPRGPESNAAEPAPLVNHGEPGLAPSPSAEQDAMRLGLPTLPEVRYYSSRELDVRPQIKVGVVPDYPSAAQANGTTGKVIVEVLINEEGNVDDVNIVRAAPSGYFEDAAIAAWRKAKFTAGMIGNARVRSKLVFEVNFEAGLRDASTANSARPRY